MSVTTSTKPSSSSQAASYLRHTKIPTLMFRNSTESDRHVSLVVESLIRENNSAGLPTVLGLPTGSTPIGVYRELIRLHKEEELDFSKVITFNLDEYMPISSDSIHSYNRWMRETFFNHVNISEENINIPRGDLSPDEVESYCDDYERAIEKAGGIDIQLLGIGRTGHIGFNEPGSFRSSRTRMVTLDPMTRKDASSDFFGEENVPLNAITMGVGTILSAKKIIIMALGEHKASIIRRTLEGEVTDQIPATFLQAHPNAIFAIDGAAASALSAVKTPWLCGKVDWDADPQMVKRAVFWLSEKVQKPLLKLESRDFADNHLHSLVRHAGTISNLRDSVFQGLLDGICTHPGGTEKQTIILFSPHPDDDVISMGGTLITLADQGHDVYIAYMTSGNIAVFDDDAIRHIDYVDEFLKLFEINGERSDALLKTMRDSIKKRQSHEPDTMELLNVKALIRKTEATLGAAVAGVPEEHLRFLDLPFYRTGEVAKKPIGEDDVEIIANLLRELNPGQIYVAGDLSDPHGTHRMCAQAIIRAVEEVKPEEITPEFWLYRGAWQEYEPYEIERSVPLSPETMLRKKLAIFKHESQKDAALFPGNDEREFWVRAEQRTKNTARIYNEFGLPEYYALESFKLYDNEL